ncbi:MAG: F0F1 ATP synthase subunit epsilon [Lactobacillus sp.]|nr:F0F1 ATP synthase subunit epsilon [Lactobacillus sp.]MDN6052374.1 F0F1 ATP synthase subunit epsilon [Lactobacillus sp.]
MAEPEHLFEVKVITTSGVIYDHQTSIVDMRAVDGQRSIMYGHIPLLTPLSIGDVTVKRSREMDQQVDHIAVSGGYIEFSHNVAIIVVDSAERARNIDLNRAEAAKERAEKQLQEATQIHDEQSLARAQIALKRAVNRISVYNRNKH